MSNSSMNCGWTTEWNVKSKKENLICLFVQKKYSRQSAEIAFSILLLR